MILGLPVADDADLQRLPDSGSDSGMVVAEEVGAAPGEEVDVLLAVHIPEPGALAAGEVEGALEQRVIPSPGATSSDVVLLSGCEELLAFHDGSPGSGRFELRPSP